MPADRAPLGCRLNASLAHVQWLARHLLGEAPKEQLFLRNPRGFFSPRLRSRMTFQPHICGARKLADGSSSGCTSRSELGSSYDSCSEKIVPVAQVPAAAPGSIPVGSDGFDSGSCSGFDFASPDLRKHWTTPILILDSVKYHFSGSVSK